MKKLIITIATLGVIGAGVVFSSINTYANGTEIAKNAANNIPSGNIDYIKRTSKNEISEHMRDIAKNREKNKTYNMNGELINAIFVVDSGKRVYSVGSNGEAYTWTLPDDIVKENQELLKKSLIEEFKNDLKSGNWKNEGTTNENGKVFKKISTGRDGIQALVYIDETTGFPSKKEVYTEKNGKKELSYTEEYKKISSISDDEFDISRLNAKEIPSPTSLEGTKKE